MIYFDAAATTLEKPPQVERAVHQAMHRCASPSRGGYAAAMAADETLFSCRQAAAALFDAEAEQVVFTMNATHGLNIAISSLLGPGRRAVISGFEHNAVTRPLAALGAEVTPVGGALFQPSDFLTRLEAALRQPCDAVICTHVSNVFGYRLPVEEVAALCRARRVPLVIDAAQSAGCLPISLQKTGAAFIAMPGLKRLCRSRRAWGRVLKSNCILCQKLQFQRKRCIPAGPGVADLGQDGSKKLPQCPGILRRVLQRCPQLCPGQGSGGGRLQFALGPVEGLQRRRDLLPPPGKLRGRIDALL